MDFSDNWNGSKVYRIKSFKVDDVYPLDYDIVALNLEDAIDKFNNSDWGKNNIEILSVGYQYHIGSLNKKIK